MEVVDAAGLVGFGLGPRQGRQEQGRQNRNDRDDHQQLDQGESTPIGPSFSLDRHDS